MDGATSAPLPIIECHNLGKRYFLRDNDANPLRRIARRLNPGHREAQKYWALRDINLAIRPNESVALIGLNGSGKSTLLRLIAGTTRLTHGTLNVRGRVGGILDLGAGIHPDLTGYENIFLQCALLGIPRREVREQLHSIEEFCELGDFLNSPVRHYSSGMLLRLAFAIAIHTNPEIFIIDEALAVGDGYFMGKCVERIQKMQAEGKTFLYVSHMPEQVESLCSRGIWLHEGHIRADGPITEVTQLYHEFQFSDLLKANPSPQQHELSALIPYSRFGNGKVVLQDVRLTGQDGEPRRYFTAGEPLTVTMNAVAGQVTDNVAVFFILERPGQSVTFINSRERGQVFNLPQGNTGMSITIPDLPLKPGPYILSLALADADNTDCVYDAHQKIYTFTVTESDARRASAFSHGMIDIPTHINVTQDSV